MIRAIEPSGSGEGAANDDVIVIDGRGRLAMPGLVNAHLHSTETFSKGMVDSLPYDLWRLVTYPLLSDERQTYEEIYLRTLLTGIELLKSGVTTAVDDVAFYPHPDREKIRAVMDAYETLGIRAFVSANLLDVPFHRTVPWIADEMDPALIRELESMPSMKAGEQIALAKECLERYPASGRVSFILAPSAPQRCTPAFYRDIARLSEEYDAPMHVHVLETKTQAVTAREFYGKTMIRYLKELGVLTRRTAIIHGIWVTEEDIAMIADAGASVVHNPVSNLKLGSGLAPVREYLRGGVNVALGCDGTSSNDAQNMLETVKTAALLHKIRHADPALWLTAPEALDMATRGGAKAVLQDGRFGALETGMKADLVLLDLGTEAFTPLHDPIVQLAYCDPGRSVRTVIVDGRIVLKDGIPVGVDERGVLEKAQAWIEERRGERLRTVERNRVFEPYVRSMYDRCMETDVGINRLAN
jgi:cytosine/adenosine deaminase-related metal-dependent hydrolase